MARKLLWTGVVLLIVVGVVLLAKALAVVLAPAAPTNPFDGFEQVMPGGQEELIPYDCDTFDEYYPHAYGNYYCDPKHPVVAAVYIASTQGRIIYTSFRLRPGTVRLGDLLTWYPSLRVIWGRYTNTITDKRVYAYLPRKKYDMQS